MTLTLVGRITQVVNKNHKRLHFLFHDFKSGQVFICCAYRVGCSLYYSFDTKKVYQLEVNVVGSEKRRRNKFLYYNNSMIVRRATTEPQLTGEVINEVYN